MGKGLKTYSVGFDDQSYNELPFARVVSEKFKTDHTEIKVSSEEAMLVADGVIAEYGEPFADVSMLPTYLICREVSKLEKVVLGGDGGDEMFAGYTHYHQANKLDQVKHLSFLEGLASLLATVTPSYRTLLFRDLIRKAKGPKHKLLSRSMSFSSVEMSAINSNPLFVNAEDNEHEAVWKAYGIVSKFYSLNLMSASLHTRLVNDYLVKVDRASMYASLEMRSPFLDKNLAKFAATIHPKHLFYQHGTKSILKEIAGKFFDSKFIHREKMGFGVPIENWIRQGLRKNIEEVVLGGKQNLIPINYSFVQDIIKRHNSGENHTNKIWSMYVFHRWAQQYKR